MTKVLIVDDEPGFRRSVGDLLSLHGLDVEVAADGQQAVDIAGDFSPDVLVVDRMLGGPMDGIQVAKAVRSTNAAVRIISITGHPVPETQARVGEAPFMAYLIKPVSASELLSAVQGAVREAGL